MTDDELIAASRDAFLEEAREMLRQFEASLLALADGGDPETINSAFRAAHTIKGSAGLFGFDRVVHFTHDVEALLERVRAGQATVTDAAVTLLLECRDQIERLLDEVEGSESSEDNAAESARLIALLRRISGVSTPAAEAPTVSAPAPAPSQVADDGCWLIDLRFAPSTFADGMDPLSFVRYLPTIGEVRAIVPLLERIPPLRQLDAEQCHAGFAIRLRTAAERTAIEAVFQFVADDCTLRLLPPGAKLEDMLRLIDDTGDSTERLGQILVRVGAITPTELERLLALQDEAATPEAAPRLGELAVREAAVPARVVQAAVAKQEKLRDKKNEESRYLRVPAEKLDQLIQLIGELVIAGSSAQLAAQQARHAGFLEASARVCKLVEDARDGALRLRMVQIGESFTRFKRVVHDVSRSLGKEVELLITGGDAELDKAMVEQIVDPLTHLVRNALDHGLEMPEERIAAGKPPGGTLGLNAYHESSSIVIEVSDDGRGLNRERILAKAVQRGLVEPEAVLSDAECLQLIFLPGFSTAEKVTDISGRGVGMDVVRRNIEALRGEVSLASQPGRGSTVQIRLPLTLAIIEGFRIEVAGTQLIIPLDQVVECIESPDEAASLDDAASAGCFNLRGEVLPFLSLQRHFRLRGATPPRRSVVVVRAGAHKVGLLVDRLLGEHQTVIKPLGRLFHKLQGIGGSTILGSGEVALILDIPALTSQLAKTGARAPLPVAFTPH